MYFNLFNCPLNKSMWLPLAAYCLIFIIYLFISHDLWQQQQKTIFFSLLFIAIYFFWLSIDWNAAAWLDNFLPAWFGEIFKNFFKAKNTDFAKISY